MRRTALVLCLTPALFCVAAVRAQASPPAAGSSSETPDMTSFRNVRWTIEFYLREARLQLHFDELQGNAGDLGGVAGYVQLALAMKLSDETYFSFFFWTPPTTTARIYTARYGFTSTRDDIVPAFDTTNEACNVPHPPHECLEGSGALRTLQNFYFDSEAPASPAWRYALFWTRPRFPAPAVIEERLRVVKNCTDPFAGLTNRRVELRRQGLPTGLRFRPIVADTIPLHYRRNFMSCIQETIQDRAARLGAVEAILVFPIEEFSESNDAYLLTRQDYGAAATGYITITYNEPEHRALAPAAAAPAPRAQTWWPPRVLLVMLP